MPEETARQQWRFQQLWGSGQSTNAGYPRVCLANLRGKVESNPSQPRHFIIEPGLGYGCEPDDPPGESDAR